MPHTAIDRLKQGFRNFREDDYVDDRGMSVFRARSLWLAAFGIVAEWWRHRRPRHA